MWKRDVETATKSSMDNEGGSVLTGVDVLGISAAVSAHNQVCDARNFAERFFDSKVRCLIIAFIVASAAFAICLPTFYAHGSNDDWALVNALTGKWAEPQGYALFLNALMCQIIVGFNTVIPSLNWFPVLEALTAYISFFTIVYLVLSRAEIPVACITIAAFLLLVMPGCTWLGNFTYIAFTGCCAGTLCLLISLSAKCHTPALVIWGLVLIAIGILWRLNMFLVEIPVFGIAALFVVFSKDKVSQVGSVPRSLIRLWPFAIALLICAGLLGYHAVIWSDPVWHDWDDFNEVRSEFSDYGHKDYATIADDLAAIGVSENDYGLLRSWVTEDPEFFTLDRLEAVTEISTVSNDISVYSFARSVLRYGKRMLSNRNLIVMVALMLIACIAWLRGRTRVFSLAVICIAVLVGITLVMLGRLPTRVHYPLWLFAFCSICGLAIRKRRTVAGGGVSSGAHIKLSPKGGARAWTTAVACVSIAIPLVAAGLTFSHAIPKWSNERVDAVVHVSTFEPQTGVLDYVRDHPDNVFVMHPGTLFDISYACRMIAPIPEDVNDRIIGIGGWSVRSPYGNARNANACASNPIKSLVDNDNVLYISKTTKSANQLKTYLREHYYPNATYREVGKTTGWRKGKSFCVFKFTAE